MEKQADRNTPTTTTTAPPRLADALTLATLPRKQRTLLNALADGKKYSVADLSIKTHQSDPRGRIRDLRQRGFNILDEWRNNADNDGRYKVYWLAR